MYEFEDVAQMLDQIADAMPYELYRDFRLYAYTDMSAGKSFTAS